MLSPDARHPRVTVWTAFVVWLTAALVVALMLALWLALPALLLAFASAIFAVMLRAAARPLSSWAGIPDGLSLILAGLVLLAVPVTAAMLIGPELKTQLVQMAKRLPAAIDAIERRFDFDLSDVVRNATGQGADAAKGGEPAREGLLPGALQVGHLLLSQLGTAGNIVISGLAGLLIVIVGGFFLAADPGRYKRGLVMLVPASYQPQAEKALDNCGNALALWLRAQAISMAAVGALTGLGAWLIGLPSPLAIGFLTGVLEFVPILGPWLGAIPVLLLAVGHGPEMVLLAALLLLVVQQLEANLITPLVQQRMADIPPFLVLFGVLVFGLMFGVIGIIVAGPLTLVAYVLVMELYVRDALGQPVDIPGERDA